jgi:hypothetical protein
MPVQRLGEYAQGAAQSPDRHAGVVNGILVLALAQFSVTSFILSI